MDRNRRHQSNQAIGSPLSEHSPAEPKLRLLIVDDSADDRALVLRELRRELPSLDVTEVADSEHLEAAFLEESFDLVITDYRLFWADGLDVVRRVKRRWIDAAVIMFTGTGNEEVAVEAMKAGADDYVLKSHKQATRLRGAVQLALRMHRHRLNLDLAELRYKTLFDTVPVGLFRCTPSGRILDANAAFAAMLGYSNRNDLRQLNFICLQAREGGFEQWRDELERNGSVAHFETQLRSRDHQARWVEIHARALREPETRQIYYEGSLEDITTRKEAEMEREKLIEQLQSSVNRVKLLTGLLPICASCKKIRDQQGTWNMLESYIERHSDAHFTHSFCPDCVRRLYPEVFLDTPKL